MTAELRRLRFVAVARVRGAGVSCESVGAVLSALSLKGNSDTGSITVSYGASYSVMARLTRLRG